MVIDLRRRGQGTAGVFCPPVLQHHWLSLRRPEGRQQPGCCSSVLQTLMSASDPKQPLVRFGAVIRQSRRRSSIRSLATVLLIDERRR